MSSTTARRFARIAAVVALIGTIALGLSSPASAADLRTKEPVPVTQDEASIQKATTQDVEGRLASDPRLARQVQSAAVAGDLASASSLLGYEVSGVDADPAASADAQANRVVLVEITIEVECHTHSNGTVHCTIRIRVEITPILA